jgi:hypothetical protein
MMFGKIIYLIFNYFAKHYFVINFFIYQILFKNLVIKLKIIITKIKKLEPRKNFLKPASIKGVMLFKKKMFAFFAHI